MTTFAGFRALAQITQRKSKISQGFADKALEVLGQVAVFDALFSLARDLEPQHAPMRSSLCQSEPRCWLGSTPRKGNIKRSANY